MDELTLDVAWRIGERARQKAEEMGIRVAVAVVDAGGHAMFAFRMEGCNFFSPDIAKGKAMASAGWKIPSGALAQRWQSPATSSALTSATGNRIVPVQGGVPIFSNGRCIGAVAASGAKSEEDEEVARAGVAAVGLATE
jgi:uncharacterized protein GlcG (DUF336 family)